jgi:uncharacterized protein
MSSTAGQAGWVTHDQEPDENSARRRLAALGPDECRALLARAHVGRVVFVDGRGPVALPVNYRLLDDDVVFRTAASSSLLASSYADRVGFEIDEIDEHRREGWSVLVTGSVRLVTDQIELDDVRRLGVRPWAEGERTQYLRLTMEALTGRRLVIAEDALPPDGALPEG